MGASPSRGKRFQATGPPSPSANREAIDSLRASLMRIDRSDGIRMIGTPLAAPRVKTHAERWVGSLPA
jgi:hypothetical protein